MGHKRCNSSDHISMSEICARELRATLLGNQPDWKPTHETAAWVHWYNTRRPHLALGGITPQQAENQHTTTRKEAASTNLHKTRDLTNNARATAPVTWRDTRYGPLHPLRGAAPDQKGCHAYGSGALPPTTSTTADSSSRHTQAAASDAATQPRNTCPAPNKRRYTRSVALHPIRRGALPTDRVRTQSQEQTRNL